MTTGDARKAHQIALDYLENSLLNGELPVGAQLPPERELATQLGLSRGAVREAIRVLQAQGILESQPGPGRGTRTTAGQTKALGRLFRLHLALASASLSDLTETRTALERATSALAAKNWTAANLHVLEDQLLQMDATEELDHFNHLDTQFHVQIAITALNPFIGDLTAAIREALRDPIHDASRAMADWSVFRTTLCAQHRGIYDAISARNADLAATLMEEHIRTAYSVLQLEGGPPQPSPPAG